MSSVAGAAAEGLATGFGLGLQADQQKQQKAQREFENQRQTAADQRASDLAARQAAHETWAQSRQETLDAQNAVLAEDADLTRQGAAMQQAEANGAVVPPEAKAAFVQRQQANAAAKLAVREKLKSPLVNKMQQEAQDTTSKLQSGQMSLDDMPPEKLRQTLTALTGRPAEDFMRGHDGEVSPVMQGFTDFQTGQKTGNEGMMLKGLNTLLYRELNTGIGDKAPNGGTITGKRIIKVVPDPKDPTKVHPVLSVQTQDANGNPLPDYTAPVTVNRTTHPGDMVAPIDMEAAIDRIHRLAATASFASTPGVQKALEASKDDAASKAYLDALYSQGINTKQSKIQEQENAIQRYQQQNNVTRDEAVAAMQRAGTLPSPKAPGVLAQRLAAVANEPNAAVLQRDIALGAGGKTTGLIKATPKAPGAGAVGGATEPSTPEDWTIHAGIYLDTGKAPPMGLGKQGAADRLAFRKAVADEAARRGAAAPDVVAGRAEVAALTKTQAELTKRTAAVEMFSNKVEKDMRTFDSLLDKAGGSSPLLLNKPINALRRAFSDPDLAQLDLAAKQVGAEYERLITGGTLSIAQLHVGAQEDAKKLINGDMPPKQARAVMDIMRREMANAKSAAHDALSSIKGQISGRGQPAKPATPSAADDALINKYLKR